MVAPWAEATKKGCPPTARNARTGLFTPPGKHRCASSNNSRFVGPIPFSRKGTRTFEYSNVPKELSVAVVRTSEPSNALAPGGASAPFGEEAGRVLCEVGQGQGGA